MRVHEELAASGAPFSYQALTAFCRRQGIGNEPKEPVGEYHFQPGQEMQHDTSPHRAEIGGQLRSVQTASLICCYSRMLFFQLFPTFRRFECKVFLTDALQYLQGACETCLIDNAHLVVLKGTGRDMVPVPEMAAFAERYGFRFQAHAIGDANRSARVERSFRYIETNFLAGRSFRDWADAREEKLLLETLPEVAEYLQALKKRSPGHATLVQATLATVGERLPARATARRPSSRSGLRPVRSGAGRAHDPAPTGPRILPDQP